MNIERIVQLIYYVLCMYSIALKRPILQFPIWCRLVEPIDQCSTFYQTLDCSHNDSAALCIAF